MDISYHSAAPDTLSFEHVLVTKLSPPSFQPQPLPQYDETTMQAPKPLHPVSKLLDNSAHLLLHVTPVVVEPAIAGAVATVINKVNSIENLFIGSGLIQSICKVTRLPVKLVYVLFLSCVGKIIFNHRHQWRLALAACGLAEATFRSLRLVAWSVSIQNPTWPQMSQAMDEASHLLAFWSVLSLLKFAESFRITIVDDQVGAYAAPVQKTLHGGQFLLGSQRSKWYPVFRLLLLWMALRKDQWGARSILGHFLLRLLHAMRRRQGQIQNLLSEQNAKAHIDLNSDHHQCNASHDEPSHNHEREHSSDVNLSETSYDHKKNSATYFESAIATTPTPLQRNIAAVETSFVSPGW